jgi:hypothetical protein
MLGGAAGGVKWRWATPVTGMAASESAAQQEAMDRESLVNEWVMKLLVL